MGEGMSEKEWFVPGSFNISRGQATIYEWNETVATALAESKAAIVRIGKWNHSSLDVLSASADQIEILYIECDIPDLSGLSDLRNVRTLSLNAGAETVDWFRIRQLENLSIWAAHPTFGNLAACRSLKTLSITDCGLRDLEPVAGLQGLEELLVFEAPFRSLRGIERLPSLRRLVLQQVPLKSLAGLDQAQSLSEFVVERVSRLESIEELTELPALRSVSVGASRKIGDLERLGAVRQLEQLEIERRPLPSTAFITQLTGLRKLRLESVGKLPSVEFLRPLEALEVFEPAENTTFVDGDLSVLLEPPELREVWFMDRRHYSHRREEIMKTLLGRRTWGPGVFENERAAVERGVAEGLQGSVESTETGQFCRGGDCESQYRGDGARPADPGVDRAGRAGGCRGRGATAAPSRGP